MPTAGDEGYEKLVQCPYDKSHEIRKGRMQFHLEKCRKNFPTTTMVECPFNKSHVVRKEELEYHKDEDCPSRNNWDRFCHQIDTNNCPVQTLVPVNAATVPDGDENWDNFEATGSVLENIRAEAEKKPIFRHRQCVPKSVRKNFRAEERQRHSAFAEAQRKLTDNGEVSATAPVLNQNPEPKPLRQPSVSAVKHVSVVKQDPSKAVAAINKQFKSVELNSRPPVGVTAPSDTSSVANDSLSEFEVASISRQQIPFSYAAASRAGTSNRPPSAMTDYSSNSMMTALSSQQAPNISRPMSVMSNMTSNSYVTGPLDRPLSAMSNSSAANSTSSSTAFTNQRAPNSATYRQSTAMSIAASAAAYYQKIPAEEGFCQIPIPGLGRGRRRPDAKQPAKQFANK